MVSFLFEISNYVQITYQQVRCWEVEASGKTVPKAAQGMDGPILDVAWHDVSRSY